MNPTYRKNVDEASKRHTEVWDAWFKERKENKKMYHEVITTVLILGMIVAPIAVHYSAEIHTYLRNNGWIR